MEWSEGSYVVASHFTWWPSLVLSGASMFSLTGHILTIASAHESKTCDQGLGLGLGFLFTIYNELLKFKNNSKLNLISEPRRKFRVVSYNGHFGQN